MKTFDVLIIRNSSSDPTLPKFQVRLTNPSTPYAPGATKELSFTRKEGAEIFAAYLKAHPAKEWDFPGTRSLKADYDRAYISIHWLETRYPAVLSTLSDQFASPPPLPIPQLKRLKI